MPDLPPPERPTARQLLDREQAEPTSPARHTQPEEAAR
jgi:hypothetical protein